MQLRRQWVRERLFIKCEGPGRWCLVDLIIAHPTCLPLEEPLGSFKKDLGVYGGWQSVAGCG